MKKIGTLKINTSTQIDTSFVSIGFETLDRELFNPEKCYDYLQKSGVKNARCQTGWARCEKQKGVYDFVWLDDVVDKLLKIGVKPWFNVGYGNPLYMDNSPNPTAVGCVPIFYGDEAITAWENYITALTEHFKDRVDDYEIWNEADLGCFWHPERPNGGRYAEFVNSTAKIIKSVHPTAKTGACVHSAYDIPFINAFFGAVNPESLDFFAFHQYTRNPEHHYSETISLLRKTLALNGLSKTELWQGESGYASWVFKGHWLFPEGTDSERDQAVYQLRRFFLDFKNGISRSSFFQMADMWEKAYSTAKEITARPAAHGVLNGLTYTPKMSYFTLCNIANIFEGDIKLNDNFFYIGTDYTPVETLSVQTMSAIKHNLPLYFYYIPTQLGSDEVELSCELCCYEQLKSPILIDMLSGEIFEDITVERDWHKVFHYKNLPLRSYPLILTEKSLLDSKS